MLAFFWLARLHGLGGRAALQNLPPRFFGGADDSAPLLVAAERLDLDIAKTVDFPEIFAMNQWSHQIWTCIARPDPAMGGKRRP